MHRLFQRSILRDQQGRFAVGAIALFLTIIGLAFGQGYATASPNMPEPDTSLPKGTIPPGTIPPSPEPIFYGLVNVIHTAPIDSDINNTAIDICDVETNTKVNGPLVYEEQTGYEEFSIGEYDWFIAPAGSNCGSELYDIPPFSVFAGAKLVLVIYGGANDHPLTSLLIVAEDGLRIHFLPLIRQGS